jgi:hypothetical protein
VTQSEILQGLLASIQVVMSLYSMFFAMTSAYIAGLYFFLNRAPLALKALAYFLLSVGLLFLGGSASIQQKIQLGLHTAWAKQKGPFIAVDAVRNPLPVSIPMPPGWSHYDLGVAVGWFAAASVYLALGYLTFFYRWQRRTGAS